MELINFLGVVRRQLWLVLSIAIITGLVLGFRLRPAEPLYEAQVKLQLTAPQQEDVALFDRYRASNIRDDVTLARNNFTDALLGREVFSRTVKQLKLPENPSPYSVEVRPVRDSDYLYVVVRSSTPELAQSIATVHANAAIDYFGETRALPAQALKRALAEQLAAAEQELRGAEEALAEFRLQNTPTGPDNELASHERSIEQLQLERARSLATAPASVIADIDASITKHRQAMERLVTLAPRYGLLQEKVQQARSKYRILLDKSTEATLKATTLQTAAYIQVVEPAAMPLRPLEFNFVLLGLAVAGSLGLGLLFGFLFDYVAAAATAGRSATVKPTSSPRLVGSEDRVPATDIVRPPAA